MQHITPKQEEKLRKLAKVLDGGDIALLEQLDTLEDRIEDIAAQIPPIDEVIARVQDGYTPRKGVDYFDGEDGYTPVKGKDYFDGKDGYTPKKGVDYFDGKDAVVDYEKLVADVVPLVPTIKGDKGDRGLDGHIKDLAPQEVRDLLELLQGDERLDASAVQGIDAIAERVAKRVTQDAVDELGSLTIVNNGSGAGSATVNDVFGITVDGGGTELTTGTKGYRYIEQNCTVTGWDVRSDVSGSIVFDVKRSGVSLAGSEKPTLSGASSAQDLTLTTWTVSLSAGDIIEFVIDSTATLTRATLSVLVTKT